jgi:hypothetical protein
MECTVSGLTEHLSETPMPVCEGLQEASTHHQLSLAMVVRRPCLESALASRTIKRAAASTIYLCKRTTARDTAAQHARVSRGCVGTSYRLHLVFLQHGCGTRRRKTQQTSRTPHDLDASHGDSSQCCTLAQDITTAGIFRTSDRISMCASSIYGQSTSERALCTDDQRRVLARGFRPRAGRVAPCLQINSTSVKDFEMPGFGCMFLAGIHISVETLLLGDDYVVMRSTGASCQGIHPPIPRSELSTGQWCFVLSDSRGSLSTRSNCYCFLLLFVCELTMSRACCTYDLHWSVMFQPRRFFPVLQFQGSVQFSLTRLA